MAETAQNVLIRMKIALVGSKNKFQQDEVSLHDWIIDAIAQKGLLTKVS